MDRRNIIVLGIAIVLGLIAVYLANSWFNGVQRQQVRVAEKQKLVRIAVATQDLPFGAALTNNNVSLANWPSDSVPPGSFTTTDRIIDGHDVAIRPIARGEPILQSRISDRAILSKNIPDNMRAITVPINAITGVAGFVFPGDVVDVLLTRKKPGGNGNGANDDETSVLLENVQVLAIDRRASENDTKPAVGSTATLEVNQFQAQKLTLATQVGKLTLALRNAKNQTVGSTQVATVSDLGSVGASRPVTARRTRVNYERRRRARPRPQGPSMVIFRGTEGSRQEVLPHAR